MGIFQTSWKRRAWQRIVEIIIYEQCYEIFVFFGNRDLYVRSFRCFFGIKFIYFIVKVSAVNLWLWNFFIFYQVNNFFCSSLPKKNGLTDCQNFIVNYKVNIKFSKVFFFRFSFFCVSSPWNVTIFHEGFISQFWRYVIALRRFGVIKLLWFALISSSSLVHVCLRSPNIFKRFWYSMLYYHVYIIEYQIQP